MSLVTLDDIGYDAIHSINSSKGPNVVGLKWDVSYNPSVSNTHYCPRDGATNWNSKKDLPRGYPGYEGRVWIRFDDDETDHFSPNRVLLGQHLYPGSGGGGAYKGPWEKVAAAFYQAYGRDYKSEKRFNRPHVFSWDFRFFLDDFPLNGIKKALREEIIEWEKDVVYAKLSNKPVPAEPKPPGHIFEFYSNKIIEHDKKFLAAWEIEEFESAIFNLQKPIGELHE